MAESADRFIAAYLYRAHGEMKARDTSPGQGVTELEKALTLFKDLGMAQVVARTEQVLQGSDPA